MLNELTIPSLKKLANNKGISKKDCRSKSDLINKLLPDINKVPIDIHRLHESLNEEDQNLINYLLIKNQKSSISDILHAISPNNAWGRCNMKTIRGILERVVPTGLVFFSPPSAYYSSYKEGHYEFYMPDHIRKVLITYIIKPFDKSPDEKSIKQQSTEKIMRNILLNKMDKNIGMKVPETINKISEAIEKDIEINHFGIHSDYRKRYIKDVEDLFKTMIAIALSHLSEKERKLYGFISDFSAGVWLNEQDVWDTLNKFSKKSDEYTSKINTRLQNLGLISTGKYNEEHIIKINPAVLKSKIKNVYANNEKDKTHIEYSKLKKLNIKELFIILRYFNLTKTEKDIKLEISLPKIGYALNHDENIKSMKKEVEKIGISKQVEHELNKIDKSYGNFLLHNNLSIYEIKDPSIIFKLERSKMVNSHEIVYLENKYLLIPKRERKKVEEFIRRSDFVIKSK